MRTIPQIDRDITAIQRQIKRLERPAPTPKSWQAAWDKHPDLHAQETALFRERGLAQRERDEREAAQASRRAWQKPKTKKCPACGALSYAA